MNISETPTPAIRRQNLQRYLDEECGGNKAELARRAGDRSASFINELLQEGKRSFGEKLARDIESQIGLQPGSLDRHWSAEEAPPVAARSDLDAEWDSYPDILKEKIIQTVRAAREPQSDPGEGSKSAHRSKDHWAPPVPKRKRKGDRHAG